MSSLFVFIGTVVTTAIITVILWELKFKHSKQKLLDKINSLQELLNVKQQALQKADIKMISLNSHCNLLEAAVGKKESIIQELTSKLNKSSEATGSSAEPVKKKYRGRPKKKQSPNGRSTSNNSKTEKGKQ